MDTTEKNIRKFFQRVKYPRSTGADEQREPPQGYAILYHEDDEGEDDE